jgi:hypothetical protein
VNFRSNVTGGTVHNKKLYLGGIPGGIVLKPQQYDDSTAWQDIFNTFVSSLRGQGGSVKSRPGPDVGLDILTFQPDTSARFALVGVGAVALDVGLRAQWLIRGMSMPRGWNGTHTGVVRLGPAGPDDRIIEIGPTRRTHVTDPAYNPIEAATIVQSGFDSATYTPIANALPQRIVTHKRGRPFGAPVGRRLPP